MAGTQQARQPADSRPRRRSRHTAARVRSVRLGLTEQEYSEVGAAATHAGLAKGAKVIGRLPGETSCLTLVWARSDHSILRARKRSSGMPS